MLAVELKFKLSLLSVKGEPAGSIRSKVESAVRAHLLYS